MRQLILSTSFLLVLLVGCGGGTARVKGQILENGQPKAFPGMQASVAFTPVGADGKLETSKSYSAMLNSDGKFEVIASGGELPPGNYAVSIQAVGKANEQFKGFGATDSPIRREVKPGQNDFQIDLAKPNS